MSRRNGAAKEIARDLVMKRHGEDLSRDGVQTGPEGLEGRVLLGDLIRGGIEPPEQLLDGLLYEELIHLIAAPPGTGKTMLALWMAARVLEQERSIVYVDAENGPRLIAERLQELGVDLDTLDEHFHYFPADLGIDPEGLRRLERTAAGTDAALVVFDSFADFLSIAGLEENSNDDCTKWMRLVAKPLKEMGVASLVLDHTPKNGKGPRGGGSKTAKLDVLWTLEATQDFDRDRTGELKLTKEKDRECWLPKIVRFSVGGGVFARSQGTIEERDPVTRMSENASKVFDYLRRKGEEGARWTDLLKVLGGSKGALGRAVAELRVVPLIEKRQKRYHLLEVVPENSIDKPNSEGTTRYQTGTTVPDGTCESGEGTRGTTPLRGGTPVPDAPTANGDASGDPLGAFLEDPPAWFMTQAEACAREGVQVRLLDPLVSAVAADVLGDALRGGEVAPAVEEYVRGLAKLDLDDVEVIR